MGPTWGRQDQGGPHVGPIDLAIREPSHEIFNYRLINTEYCNLLKWDTLRELLALIIKGMIKYIWYWEWQPCIGFILMKSTNKWIQYHRGYWVSKRPFSRRRELALLMAEPGKNWNSFETFIFVTLRGSSYKINQDPGREKSGRHFLKPFSRWPTSKIAKIKNKHNFGIINPMKLILVSNSMFLNMIYSLVYLKMHSEFTWP